MASPSFTSQLEAITANFNTNAPKPVVQTITDARKKIIESFDPTQTIKPGTILPSFSLPNALGQQVTSASLLTAGPILLSFYRGSWCPYCNLELRTLQSHLPELQKAGATLIAISPELPDTSLSTVEKNELKFPVLSDVGNKFARELGLVVKQPEALREVFDKFGNDLKTRNGDDTLEVPAPAVILVDKEGVVRNIWVEGDYTKRLEPEVMLGWLEKL